jgi:hypothetical protein
VADDNNVPDLAADDATLTEQLAEVKAANGLQVRQIAAQGGRLDLASILKIRLETMIDAVFADPSDRLRFEMFFESRMAPALEQTQREVAKAKLAQPPGPPAGGLIVPGR